MYEFTFADVDAHVADAPASGMEENQVALLHAAGTYLLAVTELTGGGMGEAYALLLIYVARKAGAVEPTARGATEMVRRSPISIGGSDHFRIGCRGRGFGPRAAPSAERVAPGAMPLRS